MPSDDQLDRGTKLLVDDLLAKPQSWSREEMLTRARKLRYHDYKSEDAMCSVTLVKHLKSAGYHDLAQNAADGKYDQQSDAREEFDQTEEGKTFAKLVEDPETRAALNGILDAVAQMPRFIVPNDGPSEPGSKGQA